MPRYIVKLEDKYLEWSTVVDAPVTFGMTLEEFKAYYKEWYGELEFLHNFPKRMERVEAKGTSSLLHGSGDEVISYNRAGERETCLSKEQIIEYFVRNRDESAPLPKGREWWLEEG